MHSDTHTDYDDSISCLAYSTALHTVVDFTSLNFNEGIIYSCTYVHAKCTIADLISVPTLTTVHHLVRYTMVHKQTITNKEAQY